MHLIVTLATGRDNFSLFSIAGECLAGIILVRLRHGDIVLGFRRIARWLSRR